MTPLSKAMTSEDFADVLIVIAGYPDEINEMLNKNVGLKSRFTDFFDFPDWEGFDCVKFFKMCLEKENFGVGDGVLDKVEEGCNVLRSLEGWGNGRDLVKLWEEAKSERANRIYETEEIEKTILLEDVKVGISAMIQARIPGSTMLPDDGSDPLLKLDKLYRMEAIKAKLEKMKKTWAVAKGEGGETPKLGHFVFRGSPGKFLSCLNLLWHKIFGQFILMLSCFGHRNWEDNLGKSDC